MIYEDWLRLFLEVVILIFLAVYEDLFGLHEDLFRLHEYLFRLHKDLFG